MMTHQDFEKFAGVIDDHMGNMDRIGLDDMEKSVVSTFLQSIAGDIADICESSNDRFDRDRFLKACGL